MNEQETKNLSSIILESLRAKGLNFERLSQLSGVSERFLNLLIEGKVEKLPSRPYTHGYILKIAEVLNLEGEGLWQEFLKNNESLRRSGKNDQLPKNRFTIPKFNKKILIAGFAIIVIGGYILVKVPSFLGRPQLTFENLPDNKIVVQEPNYAIKGKFNLNDKLTLNDEQIYPDRAGHFEKSIGLQPGFNTLTFKIKKFLGQEYVITKQIFYQAPPEPPKLPAETPAQTQLQQNTTLPR